MMECYVRYHGIDLFYCILTLVVGCGKKIHLDFHMFLYKNAASSDFGIRFGNFIIFVSTLLPIIPYIVLYKAKLLFQNSGSKVLSKVKTGENPLNRSCRKTEKARTANVYRKSFPLTLQKYPMR